MLRSIRPRRATSLLCVACALCFLSWVANNAVSAPLNLNSTHPGDVTTHFTSVVYMLDANPLTGTLTATGEPDEFDVGEQFVFSSSFNLSMTVNRATGAPISGTVSISGDLFDAPFYSGLLLEGDITDFGFQDAAPPFNPLIGEGSIFEFVVHVTGGALLPDYYLDETAGIILNIVNGSGSQHFTGVFTAPFDNNGQGFSDTFPTVDPNIPEPSSVVLLGLGLLPLVWRLRKQRPKRT